MRAAGASILRTKMEIASTDMATTIRKKVPPLEREIEARFVKIANKHGWKTRKLNGEGARSWPDRLVMAGEGVLVMIEFKRPDVGKLSPSQEFWHEDAKALGHDVLVTCSEHAAEEFVLQALREAGHGKMGTS